MKYLYITIASISLGLGIAGIFLPLVPTTPLLLLAAALYCKSSPRLYQWLINHPRFGNYIRNFRENKAMTRSAKIYTLTMMWATMLATAIFVAEALWLRILLLVIAAAVTIHILRFKTM